MKGLSLRKGAEGGMTLVELLVVLAILGVLMSIIVGNVTGSTGFGKMISFMEDGTIVQKAVDQYYTKNANAYPTPNRMGALSTYTDTQINGGFIDFYHLLSQSMLLKKPDTAGDRNNVSSTQPVTDTTGAIIPQVGTGSYDWWVDTTGRVHSQNTDAQTDTFNSRYP